MKSHITKPKNVRRRVFLKNTFSGMVLTALFPTNTIAALSGSSKGSMSRNLRFKNTHTGERLNLNFYLTEPLSIEQLNDINHIFRDFRENKAHRMDPKLLIQLIRIQNILNTDAEIQIVSGYRSPLTNNKLRSKPESGVAKKSFHMLGKALDFRLKGVPLRDVRDAAVSLEAGGVGYYPNSNFIHIDTGTVRSW